VRDNGLVNYRIDYILVNYNTYVGEGS
jgi:hypothetical protein